MNAITMAGFNMSRVFETECKANQGIVDANTGFKNSLILLSAKNANITSLATRQAMNIKGYTANKNAMKKNLAEFGNSLAGIVFAYADEKEMTTLKESMRFTLSGLQKAKDDDLISNCRNIYEAANTNVVALADYGITPLMLTDFKNAVDDFEGLVPQPRTKRSERKTDTANLNAAVSEVKKFLKNRMDKLVVVFNDGNTEFVQNYDNARIVVDPKTDHTKIGAFVTDKDGNPIAGAEVKLVELGISGVTNKKGFLKIVAIKHGTYTVQCKADGYNDVELTEVVVKQGQNTKVEIEMTAK